MGFAYNWSLSRIVTKLNDILNGGTTGQVYKKTSAENFDFGWADEGGGIQSTPPSGSHEITNLYYDPVTEQLIPVINDTPEP